MPGSVLHAVSRLVASDPRTDAALVRAFLTGSDEGAFTELVRRHGPTVLGVCRRTLGPAHDAEDAFQATFLVLVRRARSTAWRDALGPWLYGVALKVARKARARRARRGTHERPEHPMSEPAVTPTEPDDAGPVLDAELDALPARYRDPLVLCEIQGASRRDAARQLGLAEGTLSSRLARGRKLLRDRLARRGVSPAVGALAVAVPAELVAATARNARHALARTTGAVPGAIHSLTEEVTRTMIAKWKLTLALCAALVGFGTWGLSAQPTPAPPHVKAAQVEIKQSPAVADEPRAERVVIIALIGKSNVVTNHDVRSSLYLMPGAQEPAVLAAVLGAPASVAWHSDRHTRALRRTIERELILNEMHTQLSKAGKLNVIDELEELAARSANRHLRALLDHAGAKSDKEFAAQLRAQGLTAPSVCRQMERQCVAEQYTSSVLRERRVERESVATGYDKFISELWRKGTVRVLEPLAHDAVKRHLTFPERDALPRPAQK